MLMSELGGTRQPDEDLNMKFNGTFVMCQLPDFRGVVKIVDIHGGHVTFLREVKGKNEKLPLKQFDLLQAVPQAGVYQLTPTDVVVVRRLSLRQNVDACCHATVSVMVNGEKPLRNFGLDIAQIIYSKQEDRTFQDVLKTIQNGQCVRLNRWYWIRAMKDSISLIRTNSRIGSIVFGKFYYAKGAKILEEEIGDELGLTPTNGKRPV